MIDIFNTPVKTSINCSLSGKSLALVGSSKSGKSTLASQASRPIFLCTENGVEGIVGITPIPISSWPDFKQAVNQLCLPKAREMYDTVVIDTATNLVLLLDKFIGTKMTTEKTSYDFGSDADYGKGAKAMRNELGLALQKLTNQGYFLINIVHAEEKTDFETGKNYIGTSLSNSLYGVIEKSVDQIVYLRRDENRKTHEIEHTIWYNTKGGFSGTGGRFTTRVDSTPCNFEIFEKTMLDAMSDACAKSGAAAVTSNKPAMTIDVKEAGELNLDELKTEFNSLAQELVQKDKANISVIEKTIASILGSGKKVNNLVEGQEELLAEIINTLKNV